MGANKISLKIKTNFQIPTEKRIQEFNPNESDVDKSNPYHGVLTLSLQQKTTENQNNATVTRGPGRPPTIAVELTVDEIAEAEDPVRDAIA